MLDISAIRHERIKIIMYHIKINETVYQTEKIVWIRQITFGGKAFIAACLEKDAQGIFFNETYYHVEGKRVNDGSDSSELISKFSSENLLLFTRMLGDYQTVELTWVEPEIVDTPIIDPPDQPPDAPDGQAAGKKVK